MRSLLSGSTQASPSQQTETLLRDLVLQRLTPHPFEIFGQESARERWYPALPSLGHSLFMCTLLRYTLFRYVLLRCTLITMHTPSGGGRPARPPSGQNQRRPPGRRPPELYSQGARLTSNQRLTHMAPPITARDRTVNHIWGTSFVFDRPIVAPAAPGNIQDPAHLRITERHFPRRFPPCFSPLKPHFGTFSGKTSMPAFSDFRNPALPGFGRASEDPADGMVPVRPGSSK